MSLIAKEHNSTRLQSREINLINEAKKLNANIFFGDVDESGNVQKVGDDQYEIYIRKGDNKERQRFTIAHELGHIKLHSQDIESVEGDGVGVGHRGENSLTNTKESQANAFAADLLMPKDSIGEAVKELGKDDTDVFSWRDIIPLAEAFGVSRQAMSWRLYNLDYTIDGKTMF